MYECLYWPGRCVAVRVAMIWHLGISTGQGTVITATPTHGVVELPWQVFAKGRTIYDRGYPSKLSPMQVVANARVQIGRPYCLFSNNCDHLVREAHDLKRESPQLKTWAAVGLLVATAVFVARKARA